jgi:hypothetical protein
LEVILAEIEDRENSETAALRPLDGK